MSQPRAPCCASFQLGSGKLCDATPEFLDFCDLPLRYIHCKPIWRALLDGAACMWVPPDVGTSVQDTINELECWLLDARLGLRASALLPSAVFITPLGRVKVRSLVCVPLQTTHLSLLPRRLAHYASIFRTRPMTSLSFPSRTRLIYPLRGRNHHSVYHRARCISFLHRHQRHPPRLHSLGHRRCPRESLREEDRFSIFPVTVLLNSNSFLASNTWHQ